MEQYIELSQDPTLPENRRYEYLVAHKLGMLMWSDAKVEACKKFNIPEIRDFGIDIISPDFTKVGQVKCFSEGSSIGWGNTSTFISYSYAILNARPILITTPGTKISKMVIRAVPEIIFMSKTGVVKDKDYYINEITEVVRHANINELPYILKKIKPSNQIPEKRQKYRKSEKDDNTIVEWITSNPPIDETKPEYYQKFLDAKICKIGLNQLSSILISIGYSTDRSFQPPRWKLC